MHRQTENTQTERNRAVRTKRGREKRIRSNVRERLTKRVRERKCVKQIEIAEEEREIER